MYPMKVEPKYQECPYCHVHGVMHVTPRQRAEAELAREDFDLKVQEIKVQLKTRKPWFPWRIKLVRV
jgi:hypothetical protein